MRGFAPSTPKTGERRTMSTLSDLVKQKLQPTSKKQMLSEGDDSSGPGYSKIEGLDLGGVINFDALNAVIRDAMNKVQGGDIPPGELHCWIVYDLNAGQGTVLLLDPYKTWGWGRH